MTLLLVIAIVQLVGVEVDGTCIEWLAVLHHEAEALCVGLLPPADVCLGATLLWTDVREVLVVGVVAVDTDVHALLAVAVVLDRTTTVVLALVHLVRQLHQHTEAVEVAHLLALGGIEGLCHLHHATVWHHEVTDFQLALHLRHVIYGADAVGVRLLVFLHAYALDVHLRVLPYLELLLQLASVLQYLLLFPKT